MNTLMTYDVSRRQSEVKGEMKKINYHDYWSDNNKIYYLPNTTLWKKDIDQKQALSEIQEVIRKLNLNQPSNNQIKLQRCICVSANPWYGIPGEKHDES